MLNLRLGDPIGGCILDAHLGSGQTQDVATFRAYRIGAEQHPLVAKVLLTAGDEARERFLSMARPRAALPAHPHVVQTHSYGVDRLSGVAYVLQDFVAGASLEQTPQAPLWHRVRHGLEAARALDHLHSLGVAHGGAIRAKHFRLDGLDPAAARVRLVDLGNAYSGGLPPPPEPGQQRTRAGATEASADVLSYGVILRQLVAEGVEASATLRSIIEHSPESLDPVIERLQAWVDSYPRPSSDVAATQTALSRLGRAKQFFRFAKTKTSDSSYNRAA